MGGRVFYVWIGVMQGTPHIPSAGPLVPLLFWCLFVRNRYGNTVQFYLFRQKVFDFFFVFFCFR